MPDTGSGSQVTTAFPPSPHRSALALFYRWENPGTENQAFCPAEAESGFEFMSSGVFLLPSSSSSSHEGKLRSWDIAQGCAEMCGKGMGRRGGSALSSPRTEQERPGWKTAGGSGLDIWVNFTTPRAGRQAGCGGEASGGCHSLHSGHRESVSFLSEGAGAGPGRRRTRSRAARSPEAQPDVSPGLAHCCPDPLPSPGPELLPTFLLWVAGPGDPAACPGHLGAL